MVAGCPTIDFPCWWKGPIEVPINGKGPTHGEPRVVYGLSVNPR